jgi:hypothetical protein
MHSNREQLTSRPPPRQGDPPVETKKTQTQKKVTFYVVSIPHEGEENPSGLVAYPLDTLRGHS